MDAEALDRPTLTIVGRPILSDERRELPFTASELERMGSDSWFELVQGRLYETWPLDFDAAVALTKLNVELGTYVRRQRLGVTLSGAGFVLERNPDTVIAPRGAFVTQKRWPADDSEDGFFPGRPDFAIEMASFLDTPKDIERKRIIYQRLPVRLLWWIDPINRTVEISRLGGTVETRGELDRLSGEDVVPGFSIALADVFDL